MPDKLATQPSAGTAHGRPVAIPEDVAAVLGPLREADEYARLQKVRQRGLQNLLMGLPGVLFVIMFGPKPLHPISWVIGVGAFVLFVLASFPAKFFMPWVRRRRPDWTETFLESNLLTKAMEKLFWWQLSLLMLALMVIPFFLALYVFATWDEPWRMAGVYETVLLAGPGIIHAGGSILLGFRARRTGDALLSWLYFAMVPVAVLPWTVELDVGDGYYAALGLLTYALIAPPLLAAMYRLLAPRRMLVG